MITENDWAEAYDERVAIMEHDGCIYKRQAEMHARKDIDRRKWIYDKLQTDSSSKVSYYDRVGEVAACKFDKLFGTKSA